jgi:hypothetical protein
MLEVLAILNLQHRTGKRDAANYSIKIMAEESP